VRERDTIAAGPPLRDRDAALEQHGSQLVDQCRALSYQARAGSVQALHVELAFTLGLDKPHRRPGRRFGNGFGVALVHVLRRDQPDHVPVRLQKPAQMMRAAARLHRD